MKTKPSLNKVFKPAEENVVVREIQGEFIMVPIISGIGDLEEAIFSLNETGRAVWRKLDGKRSIKEIAAELAVEYHADYKAIERDVLGVTQELVKRKMLSEVRK